jgi:TonB family protein
VVVSASTQATEAASLARTVRTDPPRMRRLVPAAVIAVAAGGGAAWFLVGAKSGDRAVPAPPPQTSAKDSAGAAEPPLRHPCANPDAGTPCDADAVPWCDASETRIACCGKGLAAVGRDGLCGCPPGGSKEGADAPAGCPKAQGDPGAMIRTKVRARFDEIRRCYEGALAKAPTMEGRVSVHFELTPEGRVMNARVADASLPDPDAQACMLRVFREIRFDPPPGGRLWATYPILFSPGEEPPPK